MAAKLSDSQYIALMGLADDDEYREFAIAPGKVMRYRGATPAEYVAYLLRRNKAERAQFVHGVRMGKLIAEREALAEAGEAVPPLKPEEKASGLVEMAEARLDAGPEAMAMLVCICTDQPGNEALERRWLSSPRLPAFYAECKEATEGGREDFFGEVSDIVWDQIQKKTLPEPSAQSGGERSEAA